jgi:hypothetical protein
MIEEEDFEEEIIDSVYEWNEHGVCVNPTWHTFKCSKKYTAVIKLAQCPDSKWVYGWDFQGTDEGFCCGCWMDEPDNRKFETKKLCLQYAIRQMVIKLQGRDKLYQPLINILESSITELISVPTNQLTLF